MPELCNLLKNSFWVSFLTWLSILGTFLNIYIRYFRGCGAGIGQKHVALCQPSGFPCKLDFKEENYESNQYFVFFGGGVLSDFW